MLSFNSNAAAISYSYVLTTLVTCCYSFSSAPSIRNTHLADTRFPPVGCQLKYADRSDYYYSYLLFGPPQAVSSIACLTRKRYDLWAGSTDRGVAD